MAYKGIWSAPNNSPALVNGTGTAGDTYYIVTGGTQNLGNGNILYQQKNSITYTNGIWAQIPIEYTFDLGSSGGVVAVHTDSSLQGGPITTTGTLGINIANSNTFTVSQTASKWITTGGTSSQFVKGDGTLDSSTYLPQYQE